MSRNVSKGCHMLTYFTVHNECITIFNHPSFFSFPSTESAPTFINSERHLETVFIKSFKYILNIFYTFFYLNVFAVYQSSLHNDLCWLKVSLKISGFTSSSLFLPHFATKFFSDTIDFYKLAFINIACSVALNILYMFIILIYFW